MKEVNSIFSYSDPTPPLVAHAENCVVGHFLRRQKRFSVAVDLDGQSVWIHSNNSGAMLGLLRPGMPVLLSPAANPKRKLPFTQEAVWMPHTWPHTSIDTTQSTASKESFSPAKPTSACTQSPLAATASVVPQGAPEKKPFNSQKSADYTDGFWVGVNTSTPNKLLEAAFHANRLSFTAGYTHYKREAKRGASRLDACLTCPDADGKHKLPPLWVECKNVTMVEDDVALFPDAATERGQKHLQELMDIVRSGERAAMFYLVQRADGKCFGPADVIDPAYATLFWQAVQVGVEVYAMRGIVRPEGVDLGPALPLAGCSKRDNLLR